MKKIFGLIFIAGFFSGCALFKQSDSYYYLDEKNLSLYSSGDTLVYVSNLGNIAEYVVIRKVSGFVYISQVPVAFNATEGEYDDIIQFETILIDRAGKELTPTQISKLKILPENKDFTGTSVYLHSIIQPFISTTICAKPIYHTGEFNVKWYIFREENCQTRSVIRIQDQEFRNVLCCDLLPPDFITGRYVSSVICNSQKSVISFEYSDGERFTLR